jgi:hypothetical protein
MQSLRKSRSIALLMALWMLSTVAAAALSPLFKRVDLADFAVICTSHGVKLVKLASGQPTSAASHTLDCPGCLAASLAAPVVVEVALLKLGNSTFCSYDTHFHSRDALDPRSRGPPTA